VKNLSFDEIARNLLVYLKGQIPSLNAKDSRDEVLRQVQTITFTLRSTIVQLEGAASSDSRNSEDSQLLQRELSSLKNTNAKLEESLFLEMNKTQEQAEKLAALTRFHDSGEARIKQLEEQINELKAINTNLEKQKIQEIHVPTIDESESRRLNLKIVELEEELSGSRLLINDLKNSQAETIDQTVFNELKNEIVNLEEKLTRENETVTQLRQALQNKEIENAKSRQTIQEIIEVNREQIDTLKNRLFETDALAADNQLLSKRVQELESDLRRLPSADIYKNNLAANEAKIKHLESSLAEAQAEILKTRQLEQSKTSATFQKEKELLEQRIVDLEATLSSVIKSRDSTAKTERFTFSPEQCVFLFETFSTTAQRLAQSPENRDVYNKANDAISLLEKTNAIQRIPTVGEIIDGKIHKAARSFKNEFLPDGVIIHEESPGFVSGTRLVQKAVVWVGKSAFTCNECGNPCRTHEFFCPKCGLELTSPDGKSKRELNNHPADLELNIKLLDILINQSNIKAANALISYLSSEHPVSNELMKRKALLTSAEVPLAK